MEAFITGIVDNWSKQLRPYRNYFTAGVCLIMFILGIPMVTNVSGLTVSFPIHYHKIRSVTGRNVHFPSDGLLFGERYVTIMGLLFPNNRDFVDIRRG